MNFVFWHYSIWYVILGIISVVTIIITVIKSKMRKQTVAFYFSLLGITFLIEWLLLVIFKGYSYYPKMMKAPFDDSMLGNVFSQTLLSSSALLITIDNLPFIWFIVYSITFSLLEVLFLRLDIYVHHWYKTWYTTLGLIVYLQIVKKWYEKITFSPTPITQHIALFLSVFSIYGPCIEWPLRILGIYQFKFIFFSDPIRNHINDYVIYIFFILNLIIMLYKSNLNYILKVLATTSIFIINYFLVKFDILYIKANWFLIYSAIVIFCNYLLVIFFDKMFNFKNKKS